MNDPHVVWLQYRMEVNDLIEFQDDPPPITKEYDTFRIRLEDEILTVEMIEHYASIEEARKIIDPLLNDWTTYYAIKYDRRIIDFEFDHDNYEIIDRNPRPCTTKVIYGYMNAMLPQLYAEGQGTVTLVLKNYLDPPSNFKASPDVETMWWRYQNHLQGKEPIQGMGYFCLTLIEHTAGSKQSRKKAAKMYKIDHEVLDKLGNLTTNKGTQYDARKASDSNYEPLTDLEKIWIKDAVKKMIWRKGEYDYNPTEANSLAEITMSDLPKLP